MTGLRPDFRLCKPGGSLLETKVHPANQGGFPPPWQLAPALKSLSCLSGLFCRIPALAGAGISGAFGPSGFPFGRQDDFAAGNFSFPFQSSLVLCSRGPPYGMPHNRRRFKTVPDPLLPFQSFLVFSPLGTSAALSLELRRIFRGISRLRPPPRIPASQRQQDLFSAFLSFLPAPEPSLQL